jgi:UDP-glucuronate 4-epimerase
MVKLEVRILVTGAAGSIGAATLNSLKMNHELVGIDNYNDYYSPTYKAERVKSFNLTSLIKNINICEIGELSKVFGKFEPEVVIHLAARPGVRANFNNLSEYIDNNIVSFNNIAKLSKEFKVSKFIFASSSSVYTSDNKDQVK